MHIPYFHYLREDLLIRYPEDRNKKRLSLPTKESPKQKKVADMKSNIGNLFPSQEKNEKKQKKIRGDVLDIISYWNDKESIENEKGY